MGVNINILPWHNTKPLFCTGEYEVPLVGGVYTWDVNNLQSFSPIESLTSNALYIISQVSFSLDVSILDYQAATLQIPSVQFHQSAEGYAPLLRQRISAPSFLDQQEFIHPFLSKHSPNELKFSISGVLEQTPALIGKTTLTAAIMMTMYEITDDLYIKEFKKNGGLGMKYEGK